MRVFSAYRLIGVRCANALTEQPLYAMRVSMVLTMCNLCQCAHWWACGRHYAEHVWFSAFVRLSFVHAALENVLLCREADWSSRGSGHRVGVCGGEGDGVNNEAQVRRSQHQGPKEVFWRWSPDGFWRAAEGTGREQGEGFLQDLEGKMWKAGGGGWGSAATWSRSQVQRGSREK